MASAQDASILFRARRKAYTLFSAALFSTAGRAMSDWKLPYLLQYRPDFHKSDKDFKDYLNFSRAWMRGNTRRNGGDLLRFYMLYQNVKLILDGGVEGDIAELGVFKGNSAFLLARMAEKYGRRLYLLDTFGGFDAKDFKDEDANRMASHFSDTSLEGVQKLVGTKNCDYVVGYFPESLAGRAMSDKFSIVHLDADLHEPMKAGLEYFYPRVSPGGAIIMHDYASNEWPGTTRAVNEFFADKPEKPIIIPDKSGTAIVRKQSH